MGTDATDQQTPDSTMEPGAALSPEARERMLRRLSVLFGLVPLPETTQGEVEWVFRQKLKMANDE
jgi:hypothetical protein